MVKTAKKGKTISKTKMTRKEKTRIERDVDRLERFGSLESQHKGRGIKPSAKAKQIAKNMQSFDDRRITSIEIQTMMNRIERKGYDSHIVDFKEEMDTVLTVNEAKKELLRNY